MKKYRELVASIKFNLYLESFSNICFQLIAAYSCYLHICLGEVMLPPVLQLLSLFFDNLHRC